MYSVEEVSEQLNVSKVTIYAKLKKFNNMVVIKQGKKYIDTELFNLIKNDLKSKDNNNNNLNSDINDILNDEVATDTDDLININKDLINALLEQLKEKDKQISELHKLIENNQILLKHDKEVNQLQLEEHFNEFNLKLNDVKNKMDQRKEEQLHEQKRGFLKKMLDNIGK